MKICFYSPSWPVEKSHNGIVTYIDNLTSSECIKDKYSIISPKVYGSFNNVNQIKSIEYNKFDKLIFKSNNLMNINLLKSVVNTIIRKNSIDVLVESINDTGPTVLEIEESFGYAKDLKNKIKCPISTRLHGPWFLLASMSSRNSNSKVRIEYEGLAFKSSDYITSPSYDVLYKMQDFYQFEHSKSIVLPNPIKVVSKDLQWKQSENKIILFVGRFDKIKGGDIIIRAFSIIAMKYEEVELIFIGSDNGIAEGNDNIKLNDFISKEVKDPMIKKRIRYLGYMTPSCIQSYRSKAAVTVVPSRYETFSFALLEAMAFGSPVIAAKTGGMAEIVDHDHNGLLFENESTDDLVSKIDYLLNNQEKSCFYSKNSIEKCLKKYSPDVVAKKLIDFYSFC